VTDIEASSMVSRVASRLRPGLVALMVVLAACGTPDDGASDERSATDNAVGSDRRSETDFSYVFGQRDEASGEPLVLGLLNLEEGPVTFPEYSAAAKAAAEYLNTFQGGLNGRPISIVVCATDGRPVTSRRCANQLVDQDPVAFLGGFDPGSPGAIPVIEAANLAWLGGIPTTPAESNSDNAVIFHSLTTGDAAATATFMGRKKSVRNATVVFPDDPAGSATATDVIKPALEAAGVDVTMVPVPLDAADVSQHLAAVVEDEPSLLFAATPNACADVVAAAADLGHQGPLAGLDPCLAEPAVTAAGEAMEGLYAAMPVNLFDTSARDTALFRDVMETFAEGTVIDAPAGVAFSSVMNIHSELDDLDDLSTAAILDMFRSGSYIDNFMSNPYTCDGKQQPRATAVCNSHEQIFQVTDGEPKAVGDWLSAYVNW
jgi:branched-chain amino acid transport system substrate-binding protein